MFFSAVDCVFCMLLRDLRNMAYATIWPLSFSFLFLLISFNFCCSMIIQVLFPVTIMYFLLLFSCFCIFLSWSVFKHETDSVLPFFPRRIKLIIGANIVRWFKNNSVLAKFLFVCPPSYLSFLFSFPFCKR